MVILFFMHSRRLFFFPPLNISVLDPLEDLRREVRDDDVCARPAHARERLEQHAAQVERAVRRAVVQHRVLAGNLEEKKEGGGDKSRWGGRSFIFEEGKEAIKRMDCNVVFIFEHGEGAPA